MGKKHRQAKEMELDTVEETVEVAPVKAEQPKLDFDGWHAMRKHLIPAVHKKEILKADFKARKVPALATVAEFDEALKKYGVKLA
jgi:hypothetical protein